jgi:hypothetical protein
MLGFLPLLASAIATVGCCISKKYPSPLLQCETIPFPPARKASDHVGLPHLPASLLSSLAVIINLVPFVVKEIFIIKGPQQPTEGPQNPKD